MTVDNQTAPVAKQLRGFTLIEVMVVLLIAGILATIAMPACTTYLAKAARLEALMALIKTAGAMEQYYLRNNTYQQATLDNLGLPANVAHGKYIIKIIGAEINGFTLAATPQGKQKTHDKNCGSLLLDATGKKYVTGTESVQNCWQT